MSTSHVASLWAYRQGCRCDDCRTLETIYHRNWTRSHPHKSREMERRRHKPWNRSAPSNTPEWNRARNLIYRLVKRGELARPDTCEECGALPGAGDAGQSLVFATFSDPQDPLADLEWICSQCSGRRQWTVDAGAGIRTPTSVSSPDLESGASTSSATPANNEGEAI